MFLFDVRNRRPSRSQSLRSVFGAFQMIRHRFASGFTTAAGFSFTVSISEKNYVVWAESVRKRLKRVGEFERREGKRGLVRPLGKGGAKRQGAPPDEAGPRGPRKI